MKQLFLCLSIFLGQLTFGQFMDECPTYYHAIDKNHPGADTLNWVDSAGLYHGLHYYTNSGHFLVNDSVCYVVGYFEHGKPVGIWTHHFSDGTFAQGSQIHATETTLKNGVPVTKRQGISGKIGVWNYYTPDSILICKKRFDYFDDGVNCGRKIYLLKSDTTEVLIEEAIHSAFGSVYYKYYEDGSLMYQRLDRLMRKKTKTYYSNGKNETKKKFRSLPGHCWYEVNISYSAEGKREEANRNIYHCGGGVPMQGW